MFRVLKEIEIGDKYLKHTIMRNNQQTAVKV